MGGEVREEEEFEGDPDLLNQPRPLWNPTFSVTFLLVDKHHKEPFKGSTQSPLNFNLIQF